MYIHTMYMHLYWGIVDYVVHVLQTILWYTDCGLTLTGESVPGHPVEGFTAHVAVGGPGVGTEEPTVVAIQVLRHIVYVLERHIQ